ncbi:IS66 family transposase zinc-finger binding domain-containing protein [Klebsiella quasipneumoniae]|uniref:IS66 family transposase zinc-finger binding domain-containing protein n=1 Tax=Klebsiella quasipneumoniae TaxID=1463165 RepID=UPI00388E2242
MTPRDEKRLRPAGSCCPECGGALSYPGEDAAEQLELMRSAFRVIRTVRENMPAQNVMPSCRPPRAFAPH